MRGHSRSPKASPSASYSRGSVLRSCVATRACARARRGACAQCGTTRWRCSANTAISRHLQGVQKSSPCCAQTCRKRAGEPSGSTAHGALAGGAERATRRLEEQRARPPFGARPRARAGCSGRRRPPCCFRCCHCWAPRWRTWRRAPSSCARRGVGQVRHRVAAPPPLASRTSDPAFDARADSALVRPRSAGTRRRAGTRRPKDPPRSCVARGRAWMASSMVYRMW